MFLFIIHNERVINFTIHILNFIGNFQLLEQEQGTDKSLFKKKNLRNLVLKNTLKN